MPEGDTIARAAAALHAALAGAHGDRASQTGLARPGAASTTTRRSPAAPSSACVARGKHLLLALLGRARAAHAHADARLVASLPPGRTLAAAGAARCASASTPRTWVAVAFDVPVAEFVPRRRPGAASRRWPRSGPICRPRRSIARPSLARLAAAGARAIGEVLLDQRVVAGIGNVLRSETLFLAGLHPRTPAWRRSSRRCARHVLDTAARLLQRNSRAGGGPTPQHHRPDRAGRSALGLQPHRPAVPALRHADPLGRAGHRRPPRLLVRHLPAEPSGG